jgi:hypothetical protein
MKHLALAVVLLVAFAAGCGGDRERIPRLSEVTGRFVGNDGKGVGIAVDFVGYDAEKRRIETALQTEAAPASVGIVSIVNRTTGLVPVPTLTATTPDGRRVPLPVATKTLRRGTVVPLADPGPYVPVRGALTVYVLFPGAVRNIRELSMRVGEGDPVRLSPEQVSPEPTS